MKSRVVPAIAKIIDEPGFEGHKRYVANHAKCDQKHAARILCSMWLEGLLYIKAWQREHGAPIPIYARRLKGEQDAPKPKRKTSIEFKREALADPIKREMMNARQKMYRMAKRAMSGDVRIGIWGV